MSPDVTTRAGEAKAKTANTPAASGFDVSQPTRFYSACRSICRLIGTLAFDLQSSGRHYIPSTGGVIIASNHQSYLDPPVIATQIDRPLSFLAKSELFENPHFGWLIRNLNAFPVRQGEGDVGAVKETIRRLQEGHVLNIFPEGSRTEDGELQPLAAGIGLIVRRAGVPVVPAVLDGSYQAWPRGQSLPKPRPIRVMFGPQMDLAKLKAAEIVKQLDETLHRMFNELRAREPVLHQKPHERQRP